MLLDVVQSLVMTSLHVYCCVYGENSVWSERDGES